MYDFGIAARPQSASARAAGPPVPGSAASGDVVFSSVRHGCVDATSSGVAFAGLKASSLVIAGRDVAEAILDAETDRLSPECLSDFNFRIQGLSGSSLAGPLPVYLGGTGVATTPDLEGRVAVAGDSDALRFDQGIAWSGGTLNASEAVVISDSFRLSSAAAAAFVTNADSGVSVNASDYSLGAHPSVAIREPRKGYSDSNATLAYDTQGDVRSVFLAWYRGDAEPRLEEEVASGAGALSHVRIEGAGPGSYVIQDLDPITTYSVRCTAIDGRGLLAAVKSIQIRTTELGVPAVTIGEIDTSPAAVSFAVYNLADSSPTVLIAGLLTSGATVTREDIDADPGRFAAPVSIPAQESRTTYVSFSEAFDPAASRPVREADTYRPFAYIRDAENNFSIVYGPDVYNPDVTAPVFTSAPAFVSSDQTGVTINYALYDAVGVVSTRVHASPPLAPVTLADVMAHGAPAPSIGPFRVTLDSSGTPLSHTKKYSIRVAASDAAGNLVSAPSVVKAFTADLTPPVVTALSLKAVGSDSVAVSAAGADEGGVSAIHVACVTQPSVYSPDRVVREATSRFPGGQISDQLFGNTPAHLPTHVYVVCEDNASEYGSPANLLSAVSEASIPLPAVAGVDFDQVVARDVRVVVGAASAQSAVTLVLFRPAQIVADPQTLIQTALASVHGRSKTL